MKQMMMIFVDADHASDIEQVLDECELPGYTEFPTVLGKGDSGKKLGTRAFPGSSTMYMVVVDERCRVPLAERLKALQDTEGPHEGLRVYATPAEEIV